jgi:putative membrane protein
MRTSLALIGGGIAVEAFTTASLSPFVRITASVVLLTLGITISLGALARWLATERNLRHGRPLRMPMVASLLGLGIAVVGILFVGAAFF